MRNKKSREPRGLGSTVAAPSPSQRGRAGAASQDRPRDLVNFARLVRARRTELQLSVEQIAERAELSPNYVASVERAERDPSLSTVLHLAKSLETPVGALLGDKAVKLSPIAMEAGELYDGVPEYMQAAISHLLRAVQRQR